jgi:hypothetical protein
MSCLRWYETTWLVTCTQPYDNSASPHRVVLSAARTLISVTSRADVDQSGAAGSTVATWLSRSSARTR